ncbi:MAG: aminopeptidase P family protein [Ktedonobacteraceae bacterium]|nr:aminopeptidase P family protein [Ktedonobacteraceae bacterium]MBO0791538.1 aminopeptidase P family protein [Ktedonobacteraceae bacterium]
MSQETIKQLRTWLAEQNIDALLVTQPQNRSYLSGWLNDDTEGSGSLLIGQQQQILLTNPLYAEVAEHEAVGWQVLVPPAREYAAAIVSLAKEHGWSKIGFESRALSYAEYEKISSAAEGAFTLQPFEQTVAETLRQVKQPHELDLLRKAIAITDETFTHLCQWIQPGMTEKEVAWEIARKMVELGADGPSFSSIVASGPNGSMPHAHPGDRRIQLGELVTIDMGARYKGYCADMTRTICLGEPAEPRMREVYDTVLRAMKTCEQELRAGMTSREGDALTRDVLAEAGLAEYYIHSTGHGVGLQVHEGPSLSGRAPEDATLPVNSVVTVEPGVYIPGWSGTRVEDCVLIKEGGVEVLTQSPTTLVLPR